MRRPDSGAAPATILFEGVPVAAVAGQNLAAALLAAGHLTQGFGRDGAPRGYFCGMGLCHDCLVVADGRAGTRACLAQVRDGMVVRRQPARLATSFAADGALADLAALPAENPVSTVDVLVVGAGPAGLAAAEAARRAGASVLVLDERPSPGGQFFKQPGLAAAPENPDRKARDGRALIDKVLALGVEIRSETLVWGAERRPEGQLAIGCLRAGVASTILPRALVIATGAMESPPILPGWTLPGVMTTGALQTLLRGSGVVPPGRILVAGRGPLNFDVAAALAARGVTVVGVVEAAPAPWRQLGAALAMVAAAPTLAARGLAQIAALLRRGIPIHWGHGVLRLEAGRAGRVAHAVLAPRAAPETAVTIAVDIVCLNEGFVPADELARLLGAAPKPDRPGSTTCPDIFLAGEAARFGGAMVALAEGALAGAAAARFLGRAAAVDDGPIRRRLTQYRGQQDALWRLFAAPEPGFSRALPETLICRCEAVTLGQLQEVRRRHGACDAATLKRLTRAGMGRCQARYCGAALARLAEPPAPGGLSVQMPLRPIPLAALAREKPEWSGHRRSLLPAWPVSAKADGAACEPLGFDAADVVVIGAGIAGLATALFLARAGRDVVVLDRGQPNGSASGGNAGSLHAQLLSFDHGAGAAGGGSPAARTLPLQRDAIALWTELQRELGTDFECRVTGGLMLAETERDLAFLAAKTAVEGQQGIDCAVIGRSELRDLEPGLGEGFLGAAFCPLEGKINPLVATEAILRAAIAAGARLEAGTPVVGLTRGPRGFTIETTRGTLRAGRLVNAAGAFAATIGRMLGRAVPVHGAPLQMIVTEPAEPMLGRLIAHADRHLTLKQAANGAFIIGGGWTAGLDPTGRHPRPLMASLEGNLWIAQHVLPALRKLHVLRSWAAMNVDIDGAPILGEDPALPGLFHAVGANGYTLGPLLGRITAQLIATGSADRDVSGFSIARFSGAGA